MYKIYRTRREFSYPLPIHPVEMPFLFEEHNTAKFVQDTIDKIPSDTSPEDCQKILMGLKTENLPSFVYEKKRNYLGNQMNKSSAG